MLGRVFLALNPFSPMNWFNAFIFACVYFLTLKAILKKLLPVDPSVSGFAIFVVLQLLFYALACKLIALTPLFWLCHE